MKRRIGILAAVLAVLVAAPGSGAETPPPGSDSEAAALIVAADFALAEFDRERALSGYRAARELAPRSAEAAWKLARSLVYEAMLGTTPVESRTHAREAAVLAREAVRIDPADAMGHTFLAVAAGRLADSEKNNRRRISLARETWSEAQQALQADPDQDLALHVLGMWNRGVAEISPLLLFAAQLLYGSLPPASLAASVELLQRAVALQPAAIPHRVEFGVSLAAAGRFDEARVQLEQGLALPDGLVIDGYYRALARRALDRIDRRAQLEPRP